jgi:hypothetical protein
MLMRDAVPSVGMATARSLGSAMLVLGVLTLVGVAAWSLALYLQVLHAMGGFGMTVVGILLFPATIILVPVYVVVARGEWFRFSSRLVGLVGAHRGGDVASVQRLAPRGMPTSPLRPWVLWAVGVIVAAGIALILLRPRL